MNIIKKIRKDSKNAYKKWSKEEDLKLVKMYKESLDIEEISLFFCRRPNAIKSRLNKLLGKNYIDKIIRGEI